MAKHPLDDCEPAKKLQAMVEEENRKIARRISQQDITDTVFETALDDIMSGIKLDLSIVECRYDHSTGTLSLVAEMMMPVPIDNIKLHIII